MSLILYIFTICLPIVLSSIYTKFISVSISRFISAFIIAIFIYLLGKLFKNQINRILISITLSSLVLLIFIADFYSFYLQGESFNHTFIHHLRWDVIKTSALNSPLFLFGFLGLFLLNLITSILVITHETKISLSPKSYYSALIISSFCLITLSNPINNLTTELVKYHHQPNTSVIEYNNLPTLPMIAHAGGDFQGKTYTNSIEALNHNYNKNFRYFELDFSWTSDQNLVCIHDWTHSYKRSFGEEIVSIPSLEEFNLLVQEKSQFTKCTLPSLIEWLKNYPQAFIVTDIKENNLDGLELISKKYPQYTQQFIPQIYHHKEFKTAQKLGFKNIIWTLYKYRGNEKSIINFAQKYSLYAVTMPIKKAKTGLPLKLKEVGISSYAHTINQEELLNELVNDHGINNIYTDHLLPE